VKVKVAINIELKLINLSDISFKP